MNKIQVKRIIIQRMTYIKEEKEKKKRKKKERKKEENMTIQNIIYGNFQCKPPFQLTKLCAV